MKRRRRRRNPGHPAIERSRGEAPFLENIGAPLVVVGPAVAFGAFMLKGK